MTTFQQAFSEFVEDTHFPSAWQGYAGQWSESEDCPYCESPLQRVVRGDYDLEVCYMCLNVWEGAW